MRVRFAVWVALAVTAAVGLPLWAFWLRGGRVLELNSVLRLGWLGGAAVAMAAWVLLKTTPLDAIKLSQRLGKRLLIAFSAVLVGVTVVFIAPVLEASPLRARIDGLAWLSGTTPYSVTPRELQSAGLAGGGLAGAARSPSPMAAPDDPFARAEARLDAAAPGQDRHSRLGPAVQAVAAASRAIDLILPTGRRVATTPVDAGWRGAMLELPQWRRLAVWRLALGLAYVLTVGEIIAWLRQRSLSVWWVAAFAWPPAVWFATAGIGTHDALGVLFFVAAMRRLELGRARRAAMSFAAATAVLPVALLAVPFAMRAATGSDTEPRRRRLCVWFFVTLALLYIPPLLVRDGYAGYLAALGDYLTNTNDAWRNGATAGLFGNPGWTWIVPAAGVLLVGLLAWRRRLPVPLAAYLVLIPALLLAPDAPPWRAAWLLALVPALGGRAGLTALVWAGTSSLYFTVGTSPSMITLQFLPVLIAAVVEIVIVLGLAPTTPTPSTPTATANRV